MTRRKLWLAALGLDLLAGEPPASIHPVVAMGRLIAFLEARAPAAPRPALVYGAVVVGTPALAAALAGALVARVRPRALRIALTLWVLKSTFAVRELLAASARVQGALAADDLPEARRALTALVSRPVDALDSAHVASAAIESLSENLTDSYVAPLLYYGLGGLPAVLAYRAVNTADAMVGYRGRYEHLGKATARLDDLLNLVPARLTAVSIAAAAPLSGASAREAARVAWRDAGRTVSPNAGWPMAAAAGALGVWVEKPGHYRLGAGRDPSDTDIVAAGRIVLGAVLVATGAAVLLARAGRGR